VIGIVLGGRTDRAMVNVASQPGFQVLATAPSPVPGAGVPGQLSPGIIWRAVITATGRKVPPATAASRGSMPCSRRPLRGQAAAGCPRRPRVSSGVPGSPGPGAGFARAGRCAVALTVVSFLSRGHQPGRSVAGRNLGTG